MLGSVLAVALGLAVLYFLLATIVSHVSDLLAALLQWRSKMLEQGLVKLLGDAALVTSLLDHQLIAPLAKSEGRKPSYIPSNLFAAALQQLAGGSPRPQDPTTMADFRVRVLPQLTAAAADATPQAVRQAIAAWFDA